MKAIDAGRSFVVRSKSNRNCDYEENGERRHGQLHDYLRTLSGVIGKQVAVPARPAPAATKTEAALPAPAARKATLAVSFAKVWLTPPRGQRRGPEQLLVYAVRLWEAAPAANVEALEWLLLTPEEVTTAAPALEVGGW